MFLVARSSLPELWQTRTGPAPAFGGTARGRGRAGYGGMVFAEVGGRVGGVARSGGAAEA